MDNNLATKPLLNTQITIESEMKKSYLDYAMSVIIARALPNCHDGLKPVHRRILYAMHEMNNYHDKPYKKSARIVGEVIGKYHPHGNEAIYMSLVRMAQDFSLRIPLIDGQGNFGSMDGDAAAAMRYTEARLAKISGTLLEDIDNQTVDFQPNYDGSEKEPKVLPAAFPNLLVNGANGIAVGMATNIPTHNLGEVIDACCAYINNREISIEELLEYIPGPDFPTGGIILGRNKTKSALATGRGSITIRAKTSVEEIANKPAIIVREVPYQVNKAEMLKHIEMLVKDKVIEGIAEIRDESNKLGVRIAIELKRDAIPDVILNQLYKHTSLQTSFGVNMLALYHSRPMLMGLKDVIKAFIEFREEIVTRRLSFQLNKAREKAHSLIGLSLAVANIDEVIALIKSSENPTIAKQKLMNKNWDAGNIQALLKLVDDYRNELKDGKCHFTDEQATAILEMKLQKLTGLEKEKIETELEELAQEIKKHLEYLNSKDKLFELITEELTELKKKFSTPRKTEIQDYDEKLDIEDLIQKEDMVVTTTVSGFIKRVPLATYRAQKRGGKGRAAMSVYEDDATTNIIVANTHTPLLFFSDTGKVYRLKVYKIPLGNPQSKGKALINLLPLAANEKITNIAALPEDPTQWDALSIVFATSKGNIRRNDLLAFSNIQANGKLAIRLEGEDKLIGVDICTDADHILLCTKLGKALRFPISKLRIFKSRTSDGVRGIKLATNDDSVVSMAILQSSKTAIEKREEYLKIPIEHRLGFVKSNNKDNLEKAVKETNVNTELLTFEEVMELAINEQFILSITENGYGKRTSAYEYRITGRGGQGILNINTSDRNGCVVASFAVNTDDQVMVLTDRGTLIRTNVSDIRITSRNAMGVKIINLKENEKVISVTRVLTEESQEVEAANE